jgi:hypothetical protein
MMLDFRRVEAGNARPDAIDVSVCCNLLVFVVFGSWQQAPKRLARKVSHRGVGSIDE